MIARRCAFELPLGGVINLGIGMPEGVAAVAAEEKRAATTSTLTAEPGVIGGMPQGGLDFGAGSIRRRYCIRTSSSTSTMAAGSTSRVLAWPRSTARQRQRQPLRPRLAGSGGFINISQNARRLVFAGTFTAGGLDVRGRRRAAADRDRRARTQNSSKPSSRSRSTARSRRSGSIRASTSPSAASSGSAGRAWN